VRELVSILTEGAAATWGIAALATGGVIIRPWRLPEAVWAVLGAAALVVCGLLSWSDALAGVQHGLDVYLFLTGMMLLAELARAEGLFDWLAAVAVTLARGSPQRLFALVYAVGTVVTVLLSNDATAVVLTPAVYAATRAAGAPPLPYLFICAFIANAASFTLPISNPANLVVFGDQMPPLPAWLSRFGLASLASIGATYLVLRLTQRHALANAQIARAVERLTLGRGGQMAAGGIVAVGVCLLLCSAFDVALGWPTFICGSLTSAAIIALNRQSPWPILRNISWEVLPLVAGLFVLVEGLDRTGVIRILNDLLRDAVATSAHGAAWTAGLITAIVCNLVNNLPAGLIAGSVLAANHVPAQVSSALLIGVDLGPNLSIAGSLATILWLVTLRRERQEVTMLHFVRLGFLVMPPALILSIACITLSSSPS
jgi:arsenical pump membrane protein